MGKASKWFRGLLGLKKSDQQRDSMAAKPSKDKRSWSFVKSHRDHSTTRNGIAVRSIEYSERGDPDKHAIAVAAATAAVAEAAVAAAHAAAAVVRLTNNVRCGNGSGLAGGNNQIREVWAAVKIQSAFRGFLARKALRALKGLVRLQALIRGHIERKRTSEWLLKMQAILRAQARARAGRAQMSELSQSSSKSSHFHPNGPATPEKFEHDVRMRSLKSDQPSMLRRNISRSNCRGAVDSQSFTDSKESNHQTPQYSSSCEIQSLRPLKFTYEGEKESFCTAENSPQFHSATSKGAYAKRSPFTPTKSGSVYSSSHSDYPNYMSFTQSSRAKIRSMSAPRQRPQHERSLSTKRSAQNQKVTLQANFSSKAYPGSGRLDRLGMPVGHRY